MFFQCLFLLFLNYFSLAYGQYNITSPCKNVGDCYPEVYPASKWVGTSLFGWDKCTTSGVLSLNQKAWINGGYDDANTMASVTGTYQDIPWNSAAANEFFGPERKLNSTTRKSIQNILGLVRAIYDGSSVNDFPRWIHVKCGDKSTMCYETDPGNKNGSKIHSGVKAYVGQKDEKGYPQITFCPSYFSLPALNDSMTTGLAKPDPLDRFNLEYYENRGRYFFHEITRLVSFIKSAPQGTNNHIRDWKVTVKTNGSSTVTADTYGPLWTKILAKYNPISYPYGTFSSQNADNYAQYALATYVQTKLGEYPHYPSLVKNQKSRKTPVLRKWVASTYDDTNGTNPRFNNDAFKIFLNTSFAYPDFKNGTRGLHSTNNSVTIDTFFQDRDYSSEYRVQRNAWMANAYKFPPLANETLKILPLGASITNGYRSTDGNGYRKQVLVDLSQSSATMIGGLSSGMMADNNNDGYDGATIDQVASNPDTASALAEHPNVVLLHVGTNDMELKQDVSDAQARLGKLIDQILVASPDTTVFVALILPSRTEAIQANIINFDASIPAVVAARSDAGHNVFLVDMYSQLNPSTDFADNIHPNDGGYVKMGDTWVAAINYAYYEFGWLSPVKAISSVSATPARTTPVTATPVTGTSATDTSATDTSATDTSVTTTTATDTSVTTTSVKTTSVTATSICKSLPIWLPQGQISNGAGLGHNIWPATNCTNNKPFQKCDCSPVTTNIKQSDLKNVKPPIKPRNYRSFIQSRQHFPSACAAGSLPASTAVHLADLNGDGRADYLWVDAHGAVTAFLNLGHQADEFNATKIAWQPQGVIAKGFGGSRGEVHFADLNGDGRAEYLLVHGNGSVEAWLNIGGGNKSVEAWRTVGGVNGSEAAQISWVYQGMVADGIGKDGAGVRFADLNGDGRADYLWVDRNGTVTAYLNLGGPHDSHNAAKVKWLPQGIVAPGVGATRENIIFADINGDGRAEYLAVSRTNGSVRGWYNKGGPDDGPNAAKISWSERGTIATGVGTNGTGVIFADLNGDRRADYIDVDPNTSALKAWLNLC